MTDTLQDRLAAIEDATRAGFGAHHDRLSAFIERIGQVRRRPAPGEPAPVFALPNAEGRLVKLADLLAGETRALVLVFVRGLWCPYCSAQMAAIAEAEPAFAAARIRVAIVTPEIGGRASETKESFALPCEVLCDVDEGVALAYGCLFPVPEDNRAPMIEAGYDLAQLYGTGMWFMPLASTFVIAAGGTVLAVFGETDQRKRPNPEEVLEKAEARLAEQRRG